MKKNVLILLLIIASSLNAQKLRIDTISYGKLGANESYTDFYYYTKYSIKKQRKFTDPNKELVEKEINFTVKKWLDLTEKFEFFRQIRNGRSMTSFGGTDTFITVTYMNGKKTRIVNAHTNQLWLSIQKELDKIKSQLDLK